MPGKHRFARIARIAAKITAGLIAMMLLIVLGLFLVNSFDVPLSEQAKALLASPANPYPPTDNLYLALAGLEGAGDRPIFEMGQERIAAYNRALESMLLNPSSALDLSKKWDAAKLGFSGKMPLGPQRTTSIWNDAKSHRQEIETALADNQQLYQRYLSLHSLHGYYETARPSFLVPVISPPQPLRILFLADIARRVQAGSQVEALGNLNQDLQMWRAVLKGDGALLSKMLAAAYLHADLILAADMITDSDSDLNSLSDVLDPMLAPYDVNDFKIGNAFAAEFRGTVASYKTITVANIFAAPELTRRQKIWNAVQSHFFKLTDTENVSAQQVAWWVALGNSDPKHFLQNRNADRDRPQGNILHLTPSLMYNPTGKILSTLAASQNDSYFLRVYDIAAYQRLVYLVFQLKRQHIATADVASFMSMHPEWSTHPVDGKPFGWNPETGELAVNTLGDHAAGQRFSVLLS